MRQLTITAENGLHMRPVAQIVKMATAFSGEVSLEKAGKVASAKSTMKILALGITCGDEIIIRGEGEGAEKIEEEIFQCLSEMK